MNSILTTNSLDPIRGPHCKANNITLGPISFRVEAPTFIKNLLKHLLVEDKNVSDLRNALSLNHHWHTAVMDPSLETHLVLDIDQENFNGISRMIETYSSENRFKYLGHIEIEASDEQILKV